MSDLLPKHSERQADAKRPIVGLIPAAGKGARLNLPFSKELYPVGFDWLDTPSRLHPKPVCAYLLEKMRLAGVENVFMVLRNGKWDIPGFLGDGQLLNMNLAYLIMRLPYGVPFTLDQAYPFTRDATVVFGFPDIIFQPDDAFIRLLAKQDQTDAHMVLGLFPAPRPITMDMVELDSAERIRTIHLKPRETELAHTWIIATWAPLFTDFIHSYVSMSQRQNKSLTNTQEVCFSEVINAAIGNGLIVDYVVFDEGHCLDIGTPENLAKAVGLPKRDPIAES